MSAAPANKKRESANEAPARHSGAGRNPASSSFRTPRSGDPESSFSVPREAVALVPLGQVADINPRFGKDELADDTLVSFVPMKCVEEESGRFVPLEDRKVGDVRKGYTSFRDRDVIFAKVTPCMENGKAAVLSGLTNGVGFGSTEFFVLRPSGRVGPKYLMHFILQQSFRKEAARNMTGAVGLRRVPKSWLEQQQIPLPSIAAQQQIVAEIEKQFTRLDAGAAALRRVQANLKHYRAAVLKTACEGRLIPTEAELAKAEGRTYETGEQLLARILADRRKNWHGRGKYKEPAAPNTTNLPPLPEGWVWASLDRLMLNITDGDHLPPPQTDSGVPFLVIGNVRTGMLDFQNTRFVSRDYFDGVDAFRRPVRGDILYSLVGSYGIALLVDTDREFCIQRHIGIMRPHTLTPSRYLVHILNSNFVFQQATNCATGTAQKTVPLSGLRRVAVPLPPIAEQTRIVAEIGRRLSVVEELETAVSVNLQRANRLRQSILQRAFAG
jgi:type I restriction enzyme S subunit